MKNLCFIVLLLCAIPGFAQAQSKVDPDFHIYLLAGQSNMAGRAPLDSLSKIASADIYMLDSTNKWALATDPVHFDKPGVAGVGPAISFAKEMAAKGKHVKIGLVPCAWGGSPIRVWEPDSVYLKAKPYNFAIARMKIALQYGVLKGILWHQGESDNSPAAATVYLDKLKVLINRFRQDLNAPDVPFVAGEIGYFGKKPAVINDVINELSKAVKHTAVVSAAGLTDKGDNTHFDTRSVQELGKRYATAMYQLQHP